MHLQKLQERYREEGLLVLAISLHTKPTTARDLTEELSITYPIADGHRSDFGRRYGYA